MLVIRLYIAGLTLTYALITLGPGDVGILEATVIVCALMYLILDVRSDLSELRMLEAQVSSLNYD